MLAVLWAATLSGVTPAWPAPPASDGAPRRAYPAFYPADAARGATLSGRCVACHGSDRLQFGEPPIHAPKLVHQRASSIFDALLEYADGRRPSEIMHAAAVALSEQDMRDVSAYLAGGVVQPNFDPLPSSWARTRVLDDCAACHGETGLGVMHGIPVIGGQYQDYLVQALRGYRSGARSDPTMVAMARKLSDDQILELAAFFDSLSDRHYLETGP